MGISDQKHHETFDALLQALRDVEGIDDNAPQPPYFDWLKFAMSLPTDELAPHHQAAVDSIFTKKQRGYWRTGCNLAHRIFQRLSDRRYRIFMTKRLPVLLSSQC